MQRKTGSENGREDYVVTGNAALGYAQRGRDVFEAVAQGLAYLVCEDLAYTLQIAAESHVVLLDILVPDLCDELVQNGVAVT